MSEQEAIAAILDTMDEAIRRTEALIAKLQKVKAGLLHDLLTRGLDEHGQLRNPLRHPEQFKQSELGLIPKEWEVKRLGEVCDKIQDGTHFSPQTKSGPRLYLTSRNVRFGYLDLSEVGRISEKEHQQIYKRCDVQHGDVLLTKDGANTGNAALNSLEEEFSLLSSVALLRCDPKKSHNGFILESLLSPLHQKRITDMMSGNAITRLTLEKINAITVALPDIDEQTEIAKHLGTIESMAKEELANLKKARLQKQGLMQDLLTGRVRAPEWLVESIGHD